MLSYVFSSTRLLIIYSYSFNQMHNKFMDGTYSLYESPSLNHMYLLLINLIKNRTNIPIQKEKLKICLKIDRFVPFCHIHVINRARKRKALYFPFFFRNLSLIKYLHYQIKRKVGKKYINPANQLARAEEITS